VDFSDITLTFVESRHPRKLLKYLSEARGYVVEETSPGIYRVVGDYLPIQVIESKRLPESENLWLKSLANDLESRSMGVILEEGRKPGRKEGLGAYLDVIINANRKTFLEVYGMLATTIEEIFAEAGIIPKWMEKGIEQGMEKGHEQEKLEIARKMKAINRPLTEIAQITGLSTETVQNL
jgi:predicted transposase YdaD